VKDFAIMDEGEWSGPGIIAAVSTRTESAAASSSLPFSTCCAPCLTGRSGLITPTAIEIGDEEPVLEGGELFVRNGKMFILPPLEGEDYEQVFQGKA